MTISTELDPLNKNMHGGTETPEQQAARHIAATHIQRLWRQKHNRARNQYMSTELRWDDAVTNAKFSADRKAAMDGRNSPRKRWKRAVFLVGRLRDGNEMLSRSGIQAEAEDKHLETQHWLELVDGKHRYGSNLKWYHRYWQQSETSDNFFKWLDCGDGKNISLDECPRSQLEKERIKYLSAEERLNYLVSIDEEGKLRWAKNKQLVDTAAGHWKDAGDGRGIIPESLPPTSVESATSSLSDQSNAATHYTEPPNGKYWWSRYIRRHLTPRGVVERLLRKTVRRNTWIYVSDKNFNIFIGIKETGAFQHSSFTSGGLVTSAGLISVKQGMIHTLSPLSGHYRTSVGHFHRFLDVMTDRGVDMHKAKISKAEAALWGTEHITKWKKKKEKVIQSGSRSMKQTADNLVQTLTDKRGGGTWKRDVLEGHRRFGGTQSN